MANNWNRSWINMDDCKVFQTVSNRGPSSSALATALINNTESEGRCPSEPIRAVFWTKPTSRGAGETAFKWFVRLNSMEHEDGSDHIWCLKGYATRSAHWNYRGVNHEVKVEIYYNSQNRTGQLYVSRADLEALGAAPQITITRRSDGQGTTAQNGTARS